MTNEVLDPIDEANNLAAKWTEANEKAIRDLVPEEREEPEEDMQCATCPNIVDPKRWAAGYDTCIDCAREEERKRKRDKHLYGRYSEEY